MTSVRNSKPDRPRRRFWWWLPRLRAINWALLVGGLLVVAALRLQLATDTWMQVAFILAVALVFLSMPLALVWAYRRHRPKTLSAISLACVTMLFAAGLLLYFAVRRQRAVDAIVASGGWVSFEGRTNRRGQKFSAPDWLRELVGDACCDRVGNINLRRARATDGVFEQLPVLSEVRDIYIDGTDLTSARMIHMRQLANLRHLSIASSRLSDDAMAEIAAMPELALLSLNTCENVTDAGLARLRSSAKLQVLLLRKLQIGDRSLKFLGQIRWLRQLHIHDCPVSDVGLEHLRVQAPINLKYIELRDTRATPQGIKRLLRGLPWLRFFPPVPLYLSEPQARGNEPGADSR